MKKKILILGVVLALVMALVIPASVALADIDGTDITGTIVKTATVTAPTEAAFDPFVVGDNLDDAVAGQVVANAIGWTLTVADAKVTTNGYMTLGGADVDADKLASPIEVGMDAASVTTIALYEAALQLETEHGEIGTLVIPLSIEQNVVPADKAGSYSITLTYTATPAS